MSVDIITIPKHAPAQRYYPQLLLSSKRFFTIRLHAAIVTLSCVVKRKFIHGHVFVLSCKRIYRRTPLTFGGITLILHGIFKI